MAKVEEAAIGPPAVAVVGEVVRLRETLRWFDARPLFGQRVLVTRTREQASELSRALAAAGAEATELPTIEITPRFDGERLDAAVTALADGAYELLVFTSANAVDIFFEFLWGRSLDARSVRATVAAIASCQPVSLVTSSRTNKHSPPDSLIWASVWRPSSSSVSPMTTLAPSPAKRRASAAPIPLAPPLMKTTLFSKRMSPP